MHGQIEESGTPRTFWVVFHFATVCSAAYLLLGGVTYIASLFGMGVAPGNFPRRLVLLAFGVFLFLRMTITALVFLKRRMGWSEVIAVCGAVMLYQIGFALFGYSTAAPLDWLDAFAVLLFALGSFLNTGSEYQRMRFKARPENQGKLYTGGLFSLARHINYFGDTLWLIGWAMLTRNAWASIPPALATMGFIFGFIPDLSRHLEAKYGEAYRTWARSTKKFIPFVY